MTRRLDGQRGLREVVLFGLLGPPETLLDPTLPRIDALLDDEALTVDRGFYSRDGEGYVRALGVRHPVIPKPGFRSRERIDYERQRWFRRGRAWRARDDGTQQAPRISHRA